jgi:membrane peptidoglycan carboxypeptidase
VSSNNFDGPDWPAGGRGASENAGGNWSGRDSDGYQDGYGRGQRSAGYSRRQYPGDQPSDQRDDYSRQQGRYAGPRGGSSGSAQGGYGGQEERGGYRGGQPSGGYDAPRGGGRQPSPRRDWNDDGFWGDSGGQAAGGQGGAHDPAGTGFGGGAYNGGRSTHARGGDSGGGDPRGGDTRSGRTVSGRHSAGRHGAGGDDWGGNSWNPAGQGRPEGRQETGWGGYRDELRRGLDRVTGGFRAATGQWTGPFRNVGEQISGSFRAVSDRMPGRGGSRGQWADSQSSATQPDGGSDPFATQAGQGQRGDPFATQAGQGQRGGPGYGGAGYDSPGYGGAGYGPGGQGPGRPGGPGGPGGPGRPGGPGGRGPGGPGGPGRAGGPRVKRKGDWWRHWTWKKALAVSGAAFGIFILAIVGVVYSLYSSAQIPTALASNVNDQNSIVYYSDGKTVLGTFSFENRTILTYNQIPMPLQNAVLAAEDRGFRTEGAISPTGILRAAYDDLTSSGGSLSGGSTITQQFVRQYYSYSDIGTQQTASRKIKEIFVAMKLAKSESKPWILQHYMNAIYLGENSYGVAAAAQTYFGEPVNKLTPEQDAVIAALIQQPANYPLLRYRPQLIARWHYVLQGMVTMGNLSPAQAAAAKFPKLLTDSPNFTPQYLVSAARPSDPWAGYDMNVVANELTAPASSGGDGYTLPNLETGGYKIITTFNRQDEAELNSAVRQNVQQMATDGGALPAYARVGAELEDPQNGDILAIYGGPGMNLPKAQCAASNCQENTAVYAREQVGSSFKPYVLAEAVIQGMNVKTSTLNGFGPLWIPKDTPESNAMALSSTSAAKALPSAFKVNNDCMCSLGAMNVQNAFAQSSNTAFTDLAHRAGTLPIINLAGEMGVNLAPYSQGGSGLPSYQGEVGLALGTAALTINEQDTMLATIDNGGTYHQAHVIVSVTSPTGVVTTGKLANHEVLNTAQDSQVEYAMSTVVKNGTAAGMIDQSANRPIIAKTGTTTSNRSAFFIGAIPQYALSVAIFTKDQGDFLDAPKDKIPNTETLNGLGGNAQGGFGGYWPAKIWNTFSDAKFASLPVEQFLSPVFGGQKWDQVPKSPPKKKKPKQKPKPTPTQTCQGPFCHGHGKPGKGFPTQSPTGSASPTTACVFPGPGCQPTSSTPTPTTTPSGGGTATATPTPTHGNGTGAANAVTTAEIQGGGMPGVQADLAVGGVVSVVPGSLMWNRLSRRRRRRRRSEANRR